MGVLRTVGLVLVHLGVGIVITSASLSAIADDQCIRLFGGINSAGRQHILKASEMEGLNRQLKLNNDLNSKVHSVAIFLDNSTAEVNYTVFNGAHDPIYRGSQIHEMAEAIDDASGLLGANTIYISMAGFSPKKAAGMQATMNMQWAQLGAKPKLVIRVPHLDQEGIDVTLPSAFFLPSERITKIDKVTKVTTTERISGGGNRTWYRVIVEFVVSVKSTSRKIAVQFLLRTTGMQNQLEHIMLKLQPEWLASHASAAEVVSQVMTQMKRTNPKMRNEDFRAEIIDQVGGNRFVEKTTIIPLRQIRNG